MINSDHERISAMINVSHDAMKNISNERMRGSMLMISLSQVRIYTMINSDHERISTMINVSHDAMKNISNERINANDKPKSCEDLYYDKPRS